MKKRFFFLLGVGFIAVVSGCAELNKVAKDLDSTFKTDAVDNTIAGLKEALSVGTTNAVLDVSKINGYLTNPAIKILLPEEIQKTAQKVRRLRLGGLVNNFEKSMNEAAEKAAPQAKAIFLSAVRNMTFDDARKILNGGDTAATDFLKSKTYNAIHTAFQPLISASMDRVGNAVIPTTGIGTAITHTDLLKIKYGYSATVVFETRCSRGDQARFSAAIRRKDMGIAT